MKKLVPDPPQLHPYITLSPALTPEAARYEATVLMNCLHHVLNIYFASTDAPLRNTLLTTSLYLSQLLQPLTERVQEQPQ
ncbi:hypothetical protein [Pseudomonas farsensis]|uniref:DUF3077 domain-containing protein n=1 Tax=Pseudomonas farsensis TaxID=2745492 RepID=A0ABU8QUX2_9PSED